MLGRTWAQSAAASGSGAAPLAVNQVLTRPGRALDSTMRAGLEAQVGGSAGAHVHDREGDADERGARPAPAAVNSAGGVDLSLVRVHTDAEAARSAEMLGAMAYTVGRDIVFGVWQYQPTTNAGRALLVHELTHVVQQRQIPGRWLQRKKLEGPQRLDSSNKDSDLVRVADDAELKRAQESYQRIVKKYGLRFDSKDRAAVHAERAKKRIIDSPESFPFVHTTVPVAWTVGELEALEEALGYYDSLSISESKIDPGRRGLRTIGRADKPEMDSAQSRLHGEASKDDEVTLFDAMGSDRDQMVSVMVHELGHVFFRSLAEEFEKLPFWRAFPNKPIRSKVWPHLVERREEPDPGVWRSSEKDADDLDTKQARRWFLRAAQGRESEASAPQVPERPPTSYGYMNPGEDAAESVMTYVLHRKDFQTRFPLRYQIVDRAWTIAWKQAKTASETRRGPKA